METKEYKTCDKCCYDILDNEGDIMEHECNMGKRKKMYSVWESDWNGRDYPTFYEEKEKAFQHFEAAKKDKPQYVSIRECIVENWGTDDTEIIEEDNIQSYYPEDEEEENFNK